MSWLHRTISRLVLVAMVLLLGALAFGGFRLAQTQLAADIYRDRLAEVVENYQQLQTSYNEAVRQTAVTELVVEGDQLDVTVRTAEGVERTVPTSIDPTREVYVDYVVIDNRLWIRRVFDSSTPPDHAVVIDDAHARIDWDDPAVSHGQAAYRQLSDGRWIVTVTGSGALGLSRASEEEPIALSSPPEVREYAEIEREVEAELDGLRMSEMLRRLVR